MERWSASYEPQSPLSSALDMDPVLTIPGSWRLFVEDLTGDEVVQWALRALEFGFDSQHLRQLGSFDTPVSRREVRPILKNALRELGGTVWMTEEQARRHHLVEIAKEIVDGDLLVEMGLQEIHRTVLSPLKHPKDLQVWCDLAGGFLRDGKGSVTFLSPRERDAAVLARARQLLEA
jgi:hypothetical protein